VRQGSQLLAGRLSDDPLRGLHKLMLGRVPGEQGFGDIQSLGERAQVFGGQAHAPLFDVGDEALWHSGQSGER